MFAFKNVSELLRGIDGLKTSGEIDDLSPLRVFNDTTGKEMLPFQAMSTKYRHVKGKFLTIEAEEINTRPRNDCVVLFDGAPLVMITAIPEFILASDVLDWYAEEYAIDRTRITLSYVDSVKWSKK
jgi:hypothetical protein